MPTPAGQRWGSVLSQSFVCPSRPEAGQNGHRPPLNLVRHSLPTPARPPARIQRAGAAPGCPPSPQHKEARLACHAASTDELALAPAAALNFEFLILNY